MSKSPVKGPKSPAPGKGNGPKFYDGPTVSSKAAEVKEKAERAAKITAERTKKSSRKAAQVARRHPWSIFSIITTVPFLLVLSLFSTVICPPPTTPPSIFSKFLLTPLGLHQSTGSSLHQTLCYPANVYHREVLQPYIYPVLEDIQDRAVSHPVYTSTVEPGLQRIQDTSKRVWNGPVKPVVDRLSRGARRFYLTFIQPHIPYLKARFYALTSPYTTRISAAHKAYIAPPLNSLAKNARVAGDQTVQTYRYVAQHPLTGHAGRYAGHGWEFSRKKSVDAYTWGRPHAVRAGKEGHRFTTEVVFPRIVEAYRWLDTQYLRGQKVVREYIAKQYNTHLDPILGPHIKTIRTNLQPYTSAFHTKIYLPYIRPLLERILPPAMLTPDPPKSFWAMMADILPSMEGGHVAERRGKMDDAYAKVEKEKNKAAESVASAASKVNKVAEKATKAAKAKVADEAPEFDRAEMERRREALKKRLESVGQQAHDDLHEKLLSHNRAVLSDADKFPLLASNAREEIAREIDYVLKGLDKLYSASTSLTREQVQASSDKSIERVQKRVTGAKARGDKMKGKWFDEGKPIVREAMDTVAGVLGKEWNDLREKMAWLDGITTKDWAKYNTLKQSADTWDEKFMALHNGESKDKVLRAKDANIDTAVATLQTELDDIMAGFKERLALLKRTALDRIEAREVIAEDESSQSSSRTASREESRVSILPIDTDTETATPTGTNRPQDAASEAAAAFIGKNKDQVLDALSAAEAARSSNLDNAAKVGQSVKSVAGDVQGSASSVYDKATESVKTAVGSTPSSVSGQAAARVAESVRPVADDAASTGSSITSIVAETVEALQREASKSAAEAAGEAGEAVHSATRAAARKVGATPSPESAGEYVEAGKNQVKEGAQEAKKSVHSAGSVVGSGVSEGTGRVKKAVAAAAGAGVGRDEL